VRVLSFSYCFPEPAHPSWGVFVLQRLAALAKLADLEVVAPVPAFPLWHRLRGLLPPKNDQLAGLRVYRPRFFYTPGIFKSADAWFYGRGLGRWLADTCRASRPDILDAHFIWPDGVGVGHLARRMGLPYVVTLRGKLYPSLENASMRRQCARALREASAVISVSTPMAEIASELIGSEKTIHVIPNGVDLRRFSPDDKARCRRALGLAPQGRLLVSIAHLKQTKGHDEVVGALAGQDKDVRLVIVGGEVLHDGYTDRLRGLTRRLGVADRVILAGSQPYERIPLYINAADVCVLGSWREGCPNVVLESLACGRALAATNVGAVPDILPQGPCGRIVPVRDADALSAGVRELLATPADPERIRRLSGVQSWEQVAERVHRVLRSAVDAPAGAEPATGPGREGER